MLAELLRRSLPHELVRRAEGIGIHFVTGSTDGGRTEPRRRSGKGSPPNRLAFLWSTLAVVAAIVVGLGLTILTSVPNLSMVFLLAVFFAAVAFGIWPALYVSLLSFLAMNFFFIEPLYTFTIAEPHELLSLLIFLVVSAISATLAGRLRQQVRLGVQRVRALRRLYEFTRKLSSLVTEDNVAEAAASEINASLVRPAVVLLDQAGELVQRSAWPPVEELDAGAMTAARWAFTHDEAAGADTATLPTLPWYFVPLRSARSRLGVVGIARVDEADRFDPEALTMLGTIADQTAAALERASLAREMVAARAAAETERVRNTLLASVSHDFRTPLSSILGSATSLLDYGDRLEPAAHKDLLGQIKQEAEGLDGMVRNLLAIARIDAGALELRKDWIDMHECVNRVVAAARRHRGETANVEIELPKELPLVRADPTLAEQALTNIVANAITHSPEGTKVSIGAEVLPAQVRITVSDDGPGIPAELLPRLFEKFSRARQSEQAQGAGLGLAIARGIMDAHGGSISAESPLGTGRGTRITLTFLREVQQ